MSESKQSVGQSNFLTDFMLAGVSAGISKTAAAPIERIKLLIQNQGEMIKSGTLKKPYNGIVDCFKRTIADEGLVSLWRGNWANVVRYFPTQALNFAFKDKIKRTFPIHKDDNFTAKLAKSIAAGSAAGSASSLFVYSLDFVRTKLANDIKATRADGGEREFSGMLDVYKKTIAQDGVLGLYRGFGTSIAGIAVYRGLYFGLYDFTKPILLTGSLQHNFVASFLLGWCVTTASSTVAYPFDTIRRRLMLAQTKYSSSYSAFKQIIAAEGFMSMFKGCGANILRGVASAGVLALYDQAQYYFSKKK